MGTPSGSANSKEKRIAMAEDYARKILLLMDTDKNGKVSKREFMSFMEAEFDRLDTKHDRQLDVKELAKLRVRAYVGK
jgi:5S rRNA maturation endonuclease (ribonuclease M5)